MPFRSNKISEVRMGIPADSCRLISTPSSWSSSYKQVPQLPADTAGPFAFCPSCDTREMTQPFSLTYLGSLTGRLMRVTRRSCVWLSLTDMDFQARCDSRQTSCATLLKGTCSGLGQHHSPTEQSSIASVSAGLHAQVISGSLVPERDDPGAWTSLSY